MRNCALLKDIISNEKEKKKKKKENGIGGPKSNTVNYKQFALCFKIADICSVVQTDYFLSDFTRYCIVKGNMYLADYLVHTAAF